MPEPEYPYSEVIAQTVVHNGRVVMDWDLRTSDLGLTIEAEVVAVHPASDLGPFVVREQRKVYRLQVPDRGFLESITVRLGDQVIERIVYGAPSEDDGDDG